MHSFTEIIDLWPSRVVFAADAAVSTGAVKQWIRRDSIPPEYWTKIVEAAERRSIPDVTLTLLAQLAAAKKSASEEAA